MIDRREVMGAALAGLFVAAGGGSACAGSTMGTGNWFAKRRLPIGLQLYTVGEDAQRDIDGTVGRVAQIGYRTIELAGYHGHSVAALVAARDKHGVKFTSIHVGATARGTEPGLDGDLPKLAADLHRLGVTDVALPIFPFPERLGAPQLGEGFLQYLQRIVPQLTREDWQRTAALLNDRGTKLRREGLRLSYHNHNTEFAPVGGSTGLDILLQETSAEAVAFEMDVGWVAAAGVDPVALLQRHGRRFQLMHVKDIRASTVPNFNLQQDPSEVGAGRQDWQRILPAAFAAGVRKFYVEQEPPFAGDDRFAAIGKSFRFLSAFNAEVHRP